jgi:hypothetical protein
MSRQCSHQGALKVAPAHVIRSPCAASGPTRAASRPSSYTSHASRAPGPPFVPPCFKTWRTLPIKRPPACPRAQDGLPPHHCHTLRSVVCQGSRRRRNPLSARAQCQPSPLGSSPRSPGATRAALCPRPSHRHAGIAEQQPLSAGHRRAPPPAASPLEFRTQSNPR